MSIKKGDKIIVIAGRDKGKQGTIETIVGTNRVVVGGVNVRTKHLRKSQARPQGGIIQISAPFSRANTMVVCPHCSKPTRIKKTITENAKYRSCMHCKDSLDK